VAKPRDECCVANVPIANRALASLTEGQGIYPVHVMTRKFLGEMTRKLSVTESQKSIVKNADSGGRRRGCGMCGERCAQGGED
jgi:hypothetical protein